MKNPQKGSVIVIAIVIIILLAAGGGVYLYSKNHTTEPVISNSESTTPTSKTTTSPSQSTVSADIKAQIVQAEVDHYKDLKSKDPAKIRAIFRAQATGDAASLAKVNAISDKELLQTADLVASYIFPANAGTPGAINTWLQSSNAVWTMKDSSHVDIVVTTSSHEKTTISVVKVNGVWY